MYKDFCPLQKLFREWNMKHGENHLQTTYLIKNLYQEYLKNSENSVVEKIQTKKEMGKIFDQIHSSSLGIPPQFH